MNIFFIDRNPILAARFQCDIHVRKMTLESAQLLSTAHRILTPDQDLPIYKAAHRNHPCAKWTRSSKKAYDWLFLHYIALGTEFNERFGKPHKSMDLSKNLVHAPENISNTDWIDPPLCMPDEFKIDSDSVKCYREYYVKGKARLFAWTNREAPEWITK